jgi:hypothetical protein
MLMTGCTHGGRRWRRRLRWILTVVPLGCLVPAAAVAATRGALVQRPGTEGCVSEDGTGGTCMDGRALVGAASVAVSPDGHSVYVASFDSAAVATLARNPTTGVLGQLTGVAGCVADLGDGVTCGQGRGLNGTVSVAVSPDGQHVYVASRGHAVAVFARNALTGALAQLGGAAGCIAEYGDGVACAVGTGLREAVFLTVSPDGQHVYAASQLSDAVAAFSRNALTGALTQLSGVAGCVSEDGSDDGTALRCADGNGLLGPSPSR